MKPSAQTWLTIRDFCFRYRKWLMVKAIAKIAVTTALLIYRW